MQVRIDSVAVNPSRHHTPLSSPVPSPSPSQVSLTPRVRAFAVVIALLKQSEVIDKILKVLQYLARFFIAFSGKGQWANRFINEPRATEFQKAITATRKVLRLGRCFRYMPILRAGLTKFDIWSALEYWNTFVGMVNDSLDDIAWAASLDQFTDSKPIFEKATHWAKTIWFYNATSDFIITVRRLYVILQKLKKDPESAELEEKRYAELIYVYRFAADVLQSSEYICKWGLHPGIFGVTGMISGGGSLMRIYRKEYLSQQKKLEDELKKS
jgi:hypothetical protein